MAETDPLVGILLKSVEDKEDVISRQDLYDYIKHVRGLSQGSIDREREHLITSKESIKTTLISLTKASQVQFISGAKAVKDLSLLFDEFQEKVDLIDEKIPIEHDIYSVLSGSTATPSANGTGDTTGSTTSNNKTIDTPHITSTGSSDVLLLRNIDKIQDILELPSLTLTCVRNGFYSEALDLASHARRLQIRFNNIQIIQKIQLETEQSMKTMLLQLLKLLRETIKLPTLIKTISYIRRMQPIQSLPSSEANKQLQHLFLSSRLYFIRQQWNTLSPLKQSPDKYLKRYLEVYREHVFATVGGFRTIFAENEIDTPTPSSTITPTTTSTITPTPSTSNHSSRLLGEFLKSTVKDLEETIRTISPLITDKSTRSSLWLQLAYCSQSLGRVGGEFWPLIQGQESPPIPNEEWYEAIQKQRTISKDIATRLGRVV